MKIVVSRRGDMLNCTESVISIDGQEWGYGLEPAFHPAEGKPAAIPEGEYEVWLRWSDTHMRWVPAVMNVPGRSDIEIHPGNTAVDTKGCLLVGFVSSPGMVGTSRTAFDNLMAKVVACVPYNRVTIAYVNEMGKFMPANPKAFA